MSIDVFFSAFVIGLLGAGHCLGMCGGIAAALSFGIAEASQVRKLYILIAYNLGRIISYGLIGAIAGILGRALQPLFSGFTDLPVLRIFAAVMLILMGLYISGWWKLLVQLEKLGALLWRRLQPLSEGLFPVQTLKAAFCIGALWGWLPCGLVYSALAYSLAQGNVISSSVVMLAFGLGTLPILLVGGLAGEKLKSLLRAKALRWLMGVLLIAFGLASLFFTFQHAGHDHGGKHSTSSSSVYNHSDVGANEENKGEHEHHHH
ncbi:sulfite exporter TauE/SafE family protein [Agarilytica rhodophyticola]|uniref:sulfite exporter TauE/SafE family protein n=1 Tax=Agarilytica rhodophyticola TaxID=1737490 RepID=UPI000B347333|nr:sulfite exporter TauE/SafE family protein [Agarilytica rhodophyticola]